MGSNDNDAEQGTKAPGSSFVDPVDEFGRWLAEDVKRTLALVRTFVQYSTHYEYVDAKGETRTLSVEKFLGLAKLVALDLLTEQGDVAKAAALASANPGSPQAAKILKQLRAHPVYASISEKFLEGLRLHAGSGDTESWIEAMDNAAPREVAAQMLAGGKVRDRLAAAREFMDRIAPKASRGGDGNVVVVVMPEQSLEIAKKTQQLLKGVGYTVDPAVSAKRLSVPPKEA